MASTTTGLAAYSRPQEGCRPAETHAVGESAWESSQEQGSMAQKTPDTNVKLNQPLRCGRYGQVLFQSYSAITHLLALQRCCCCVLQIRQYVHPFSCSCIGQHAKRVLQRKVCQTSTCTQSTWPLLLLHVVARSEMLKASAVETISY